jgi:uroporphyrinogen decarboxylase
MSAELTRAERMLRACRGEAVDRPPVWLMRQAGRYLPAYRAARAGQGFLESVRDVERAVAISLQPIDEVGSEAVVFFSDIFVPLLGSELGVTFEPGPRIAKPVRTAGDVEKLRFPDPRESVGFTFEILRRLRAALDPRGVPLIGFAGAPFTLASYLVRGAGDPDRVYPELRAMMAEEPATADALLARLGDLTIAYLNAQIEAGAQVVQLFDSWCGVLDEPAYRRFALPVTRRIVDGVDRSRAPFILFASDAPHLVGAMLESGCDVLSVGASVDLAGAARLAGARASLQGNLDPAELAVPRERIFARVREMAEHARGARGWIANLGHGCLPETPVEGVRAFTDAVRALGSGGA